MGICIVMSVWVVVGSIIALLQPAPAGVAMLWSSPYESTPLTHHLTHVSVAYFLWDAFVCVYDRADIFFHSEYHVTADGYYNRTALSMLAFVDCNAACYPSANLMFLFLFSQFTHGPA